MHSLNAANKSLLHRLGEKGTQLHRIRGHHVSFGHDDRGFFVYVEVEEAAGLVHGHEIGIEEIVLGIRLLIRIMCRIEQNGIDHAVLSELYLVGGVKILLFFDAYGFDVLAKQGEKATQAEQKHTADQDQHGILGKEAHHGKIGADGYHPNHEEGAQHP